MKTFSLISAIAALFLSACDRHEWEGEEGTKKLYEAHGEHGEAHGDGHGKGHDDGHGAEGDHGKDHEGGHGEEHKDSAEGAH